MELNSRESQFISVRETPDFKSSLSCGPIENSEKAMGVNPNVKAGVETRKQLADNFPETSVCIPFDLIATTKNGAI